MLCTGGSNEDFKYPFKYKTTTFKKEEKKKGQKVQGFILSAITLSPLWMGAQNYYLWDILF